MMAMRFTLHVVTLDPQVFPTLEFWSAFRAAVQSRMNRRGLLGCPPTYLGYAGSDWQEVLNDLIFDCYEFSILDRLAALRAQLNVRHDIDGLVIRNIDNFLLDRQRRHDRLGYVVFKNLEASVLLALHQGLLVTDALHEGRIRTDAHLAFAGARPNRLATADEVCGALKSCGVWQGHLDHLGRLGERAQQVLLSGLPELLANGINAFVFKDLVEALKSETRDVVLERTPQPLHLGQLTDEDDAWISEFARKIRPEPRYEDHEQYQHRLRRLRETLAQLDRRSETRRRVLELLEEFIALASGDDPLPSHAELARRLGLAPSTLADHVKLIRAAWQTAASSPDQEHYR